MNRNIPRRFLQSYGLRLACGGIVVMARETRSVSDCLPAMLQPAVAVVAPGRTGFQRCFLSRSMEDW
ncbi:MAG: hypothetical protein Q4D38_12695 [Planctomycetia bacterium]|nr:hypothetical protein [Planctomycetia bacterium]